MRRFWIGCIGLVVANAGIAVAEDWPRFLGSEGKLIANESASPPVEWSADNNIKWSTNLPGKGVSSPIVVGDRVFVTCYSGYGVGEEEGSIDDLKRHLVCVDRKDGNLLWDAVVDAAQPEDPYSGIGVPAHGYASHTPISDGERVYVFFGKSGVIAYDLQGKKIWQTDVGSGSDPNRWGSAASPVLYQDSVIVNASAESESLVALDKKSGEVKWESSDEALQNSWSTPALVSSNGRTDLVLMVPNQVWGIDPETGDRRWYSRGTTDRTAAASVVPGDGRVYATGGRSGDAVAVNIGGEGDVNDSHVVWDANIPGRFATPVLHDGHLYGFAGGIISVFDAESGKRIEQKRLTESERRGGPGGPGGRFGRGGRDAGERPEGGDGDRDRGNADGRREGAARGDAGRGDAGRGDDSERRRRRFGRPDGEGRRGPGGGRFGRGGPGGGGRGGMFSMDYASPVIAGDRLYVTTRDGKVFVLSANPELELLATNGFGDDTGFGGTPAVSNGELFFRSDSRLYCIADTAN